MTSPVLAARCPACRTVFRVVPDQLRVSEGWVRCGRCSEVFNAAASLVDVQTGAPRPASDALQAQDAAVDSALAMPAAQAAAPQPAAQDMVWQPAPPAAQTEVHLGLARWAHETPVPEEPPGTGPLLYDTAPLADAQLGPAASDAGDATLGLQLAETAAAAADGSADPLPETALTAYAPYGAPDAAAYAAPDAAPDAAPYAAPYASPDAAAAAAPTAAPIEQPAPTWPDAMAEVLTDAPFPAAADEQPEWTLDVEPAAAAPVGDKGRDESESETAPERPQTWNTEPVPDGPGATADTTTDATPEATSADVTIDAIEPDAPASTGNTAEPSAEPSAEQAAADSPADQTAGAATDIPPSFMRQAERAERWRQPKVRAGLAALGMLAAVALVAQMSVAYRDSVAARFPGARPLLEAACTLLSCRVGAAQAINSLSVESSGLVRVDQTHVYKLQVALRNRAGIDVALPALELSLSDAQGRLVARKVLRAAELGVRQVTLGAGADLALQATLEAAPPAFPEPIAGYTIELFYP